MSTGELVDPYLSVMLLAVAPISLYVIVYYAEVINSSTFFAVSFITCCLQPGFPWHTYVTLFIGYYASFAILLLVPIDIAAVVANRKSTTIGSDSNYSSNRNTLSTAYDAFFTIILILGSFLLVFEEYYNTDGKLLYPTR